MKHMASAPPGTTPGCWTACARRSSITPGLRASLADRSRHQGRARRTGAHRPLPRSRHGHRRQHGAGELRCLLLPRHIGLYAGVPLEAPAHLVQRVCGTGIEMLMRPPTRSRSARGAALCVGAESMSRNPSPPTRIAAASAWARWSSRISCGRRCSIPRRTHDGRHRGESRPPYQIRRPEVDAFAARSFERAMAAQENGFLAGEIAPVKNETFDAQGLQAARHPARPQEEAVDAERHIRRRPLETLAKSVPHSAACKPAATARRSSTAPRRQLCARLSLEWSTGPFVRLGGPLTRPLA